MFVCPKLIKETGRLRKLIFGISGQNSPVSGWTLLNYVLKLISMVKMNIFHAWRHESAEYNHKTTAQLFCVPHVAKRPSKRSALVIKLFYHFSNC